MSGSADAVQAAVHALESGRTAVWVRRTLLAALIAGLSLFYLLCEFRGLATSEGMDQAQIGRALLHGHGWLPSLTRWLILAMWFGSIVRMALYGINEEQGVTANQLHLLFVPIMTCFGLAFLLVHWSRLEISGRLAQSLSSPCFFSCADGR